VSVRHCHACDVSYAPDELYRTAFGGAASRPINEVCSICHTETKFQLEGQPSDTAAVTRARLNAEFDRYYTDYALKQHAEDLAKWPELARTAERT
jgi:hypothetical protein